MIPRKIHYCWFGGGPKSGLNLRCIETWNKVMPGFEVKEWNETNSPLNNPYCRAAYERKEWARLSNYVRFHALSLEGGFYFDTDVEVLRSFEVLRDNTCFLGFQTVTNVDEWVGIGVIGAEPGHPFPKKFLEFIERYYLTHGEFRLGPRAATTVLREQGLNKYGAQVVGDVRLYTTEYFYPYGWKEVFTPECVTADTFSVHHWEGSWIKPVPLRRRVLSKGLQTFRHLFARSKELLGNE